MWFSWYFYSKQEDFSYNDNCNYSSLPDRIIQLTRKRRYIAKDEMCSYHTRLGAGGYIFL